MLLRSKDFSFIDSRFETTDLLLETAELLFYKAREKVTGKRVILKLLKARFPAESELAKLQNHFNVVQHLSVSEHVVQALECWQTGGVLVLILEDLGGGSLRQFSERRLYSESDVSPVRQYIKAFHIALKIAQAIAYLQREEVFHGNINPDSVWVNLHSNSIRLCDFSFAQVKAQGCIESWRAEYDKRDRDYLAPEIEPSDPSSASLQSDIYALGSVLWFMLSSRRQVNDVSNRQAFNASQYPEQFLSDVDLNAPGGLMLRTLLQKLLHVDPSKRYADSQSLIKDLKHCIAWLDSGVTQLLDDPAPADDNVFYIGDELFGRDVEIATLADALESTSDSGSDECSFKVVKLTGRAGMGKSALARHFLRSALARGSIVAQGQYGQYRSDEPLSALLDACGGLLLQVLSEPVASQARWKEKLVIAMQGEARVLADLIPSLGELLGPQPELPSISGELASRRFSRVLRQFISVFYQPGCPLVLYLDDLQWADQSSIRLLRDLCTSMDEAHLLLVLAYRNDQSIALLPGRSQFLELASDRPCTVVVELQALTSSDISRIVAKTLGCSQAKAGPLARLVEQKTSGDPFYARQFLYALHREGQITYSTQDSCWTCDLSAVRRSSLTEHVVTFMSNRLLELEPEVLELLQVMSCLGTNADVLTLAQAMDQSRLKVARLIWAALSSGLVVLERDVYKFQHSANDDEPVDEFTVLYGEGLEYCLLHDRVRQAAYNLIPTAERGKWHASIGQRLLANFQRGSDDRSLFDILDKLGSGLAYINDTQERSAMAALFLKAGGKARAYIAYDESLSYFQRGIEVLGPECWQNNPSGCVELYLEAATSALQASRFSTAFALLDEIENQLSTPIEILQHAILRVQLCCLVNKLHEALEQGYRSLQRYGWDRLTSAQVHEMLGAESRDFVLETSPVAKLEDQFALVLLLSMTPAAFYTTAEAYRELAVTQLLFSAKRGACANASLALCNYGALFLGGVEHKRAEALFQQVIAVEKKLPDNEVILHKDILANSLYRHWHTPLRVVVSDSEASASESIDRGDYTFAAYAAIFIVEKSFFCCQSLNEFEQQVGGYATFTGQVLHQVPNYQLGVWHQVALNLIEGTLEFSELEGKAFSERQSLSVLENNNNEMILFYLYFTKALLALHFDHPLAASRNISKAKQTIQSCSATFCGSLLQVFEIMIAYSIGEREQAQQLLMRYRLEVVSCERHSSVNLQHYELFLDAIELDAKGELKEAYVVYQQALDLALQSGMVHDALLMKERMARCYVDNGMHEQASKLFEQCYHDYSRWGARAKADHLRRQFSDYMPLDLSL